MPSTPSSLDCFYGKRTLAGQQAREIVLSSPLLTENDRRPIATYLSEIRSRGVSGRRLTKVAFTLSSFRQYLDCDYQDCTLLAYRTAIANLHDIGSHYTGKPFAQQTLVDFILISKQFLQFMIENEMCTMSETELGKVRVPAREGNYLTHADILTPEEVIAFINACKNNRDRALFSMLYEGGFRIGEIGTLTWGDLTFDPYGILVTVIFKTGKPRTIRLLSCTRDVSAWKATTKAPTGPGDLVFTQLKSGHPPITYGMVSTSIRKLAVSAGITKRVYPHLFRHSRITHMLSDGIHESVIKLMMWGDIGSDQLKTYAHLSTTNIDKALFDCYGIQTPNVEKRVTYTPITCPHCKQINPPGTSYCSACGQVTAEDEIYTADALQDYLTNHPELIIEYLKQRESQ